MYKILLILLLLFLDTYIGSAQYVVSGVLQSESENKPLAFIEVMLVQQDSLIVAGAVTDENGQFLISIAAGDYKMRVDWLKKKVYEQTLSISQNVHLGVVRINTTIESEGVTIVAKTPLIEKKIDRVIFNVEQSVSAQAGDAMDALRLAPRVRTQDDRLSIIGKGDVSVMINGRLLPLSGDELVQYLKSISANTISKIEVITTPPAKYDAGGSGGLINIQLKKMPIDSWSLGVNGTYTQRTYMAGLCGLNANYRKKKIHIYTDLNGSKGSSATNEFTVYTYSYSQSSWRFENQRKDFFKNVTGQLGLDYFMHKNVTMGFLYIPSRNAPHSREYTNTYAQGSNLDSTILTPSTSIGKRNSHTLNVYMDVKLDTLGRKLSIYGDFYRYQSHGETDLSSMSYDTNGNAINSSYYAFFYANGRKINNFSTQLDLSLPYKWIDVNIGAKVAHTLSQNQLDFFNTSTQFPKWDSTRSNIFHFKENIQSAYITGNKKLGENWEMQTGVRVENTQTTGHSLSLHTTNTYQYLRVFPSVYLSYTHKSHHIFNLSYSRRLNRPPFRFFNPLRIYYTPFYYLVGNPYLQSSIANGLEMSYNFKENFSAVFYYNFNQNQFNQIPIANAQTKIVEDVPYNYFDNHTIGVLCSYFFSHKDRFESANEINVNYSKNQIHTAYQSLIPSNLSVFTGSIFSRNTLFIHEKKYALEASFFYELPGIDGVYRYSSRSNVSLAFRSSFFNKRLICRVIWSDIFKQSVGSGVSNIEEVQRYAKNYYDNRYFRINISYKIGSTKISYNKHKVSNDNERTRIN